MFVIAIGDHYRSIGDAAPPGIYRVVGRRDDVTLLRVTDADGRRRHTGELVTVQRERIEEAFEAADGPDSGLALGHLLLGPIRNLYWSIYAVWVAIRRRLS